MVIFGFLLCVLCAPRRLYMEFGLLCVDGLNNNNTWYMCVCVGVQKCVYGREYTMLSRHLGCLFLLLDGLLGGQWILF